jgi:hypothetical protein
MKKLLAILMLAASPALAAEKMELCDFLFYADEGKELIITGAIKKLSDDKKSFDIINPKEDCGEISVFLKKQAPKNCKVGSAATVQGKVSSDPNFPDMELLNLTNATVKCTAAAKAQLKE